MRFAALAILAFAACEPSAPELDGAPTPAPTPVEDNPPPGDLAGGPPPGALLAGVINLVPPPDMRVIENCEAIIASDYTTPPKMACLLYPAEASQQGQPSIQFSGAMAAAGWTFVRAQGSELYFERLKPGGTCADVAVVSVVGDRTQKLVEHAKAGAPPAGMVWRAFSIPASIHEACGADRMKP